MSVYIYPSSTQAQFFTSFQWQLEVGWDHTFLTDQIAVGTGSVALYNKITPSLPSTVLSLEDSGRRARAAKEDKSTAEATAAEYRNNNVKI